jgi:hypothetical protein
VYANGLMAIIKKVGLGLSQVANTWLLKKCKAKRFEQNEWLSEGVASEKKI